MIKNQELIEDLLTETVLNGEPEKFAKKLREIKCSANQIKNYELFGDDKLSELVAEVMTKLDTNKSTDKALSDLVKYTNELSKNNNNKTFSEGTKMADFTTPLTDKEIDTVSADNIAKINDKVVNMENVINDVSAKLGTLVQDNATLMGTMGVPVADTRPVEDKVEEMQHSITAIADTLNGICHEFSNLYNYIGFSEAQAEAEKEAEAVATEAAAENVAEAKSQAWYAGFDFGKSAGRLLTSEEMAAAAAQSGFEPGSDEFEKFIEGCSTVAETAAQVHSYNDYNTAGSITFSEGDNAFISDNNFFSFDDNSGAYFSMNGDILCHDADGELFSCSMLEFNALVAEGVAAPVTIEITAPGATIAAPAATAAPTTTIATPTGTKVVKVVETDAEGNALLCSATGEEYLYSASTGEVYDYNEFMAFSEEFSASNYDDSSDASYEEFSETGCTDRYEMLKNYMFSDID